MNTKKLATILVTLSFLLVPVNVQAEEEEICVETAIYGGGVGVVCSAKTHEPVDTGVEDVIPFVASGLLAASYGFYKFGKNQKATS